MEEPVAAHIVSKCEESKNGHKCYQEIKSHFTSEVATHNYSLNLLQKVSKADIRTTKKGCAPYLLKWATMLQSYERMQGDVSDTNKIAWLVNTVSGVPALDAIPTKAIMDITTGAIKKTLDYESHFKLVHHEATLMDQRRHNEATGRRVNFTDIDPWSDDESDDMPDLTDDLDDIRYDVHKNRSKFKRPTVDKSTWSALSDDDKKLWDELSSKGRYSILQYGKSLVNKDKKVSTRVKMADTEPRDDEEDSSDEPEGDDKVGDASNTTLTVNKASKKGHAGDIRNLLGTKTSSDRTVKMARVHA